MFKFQSTTIINSAARVTAANGVLKIVGGGKFNVADIKKVYKREAETGTASSAVFDLTAASTALSGYSGDFRLAFYVKLDGSNNSSFANDMVFKGRPFTYDFASEATTADELATAIKNIVDKSAKRFGDKVFNVTTGTFTDTNNNVHNTLTFAVAPNANVTEEDVYYINITEAKLMKLADSTAKGEQSKVVATVEATKTANSQPFGTYGQITKDLILPTYENTGWASVASVKNELPLIGQEYTQYIIHYCKDRGIMGGSAVGQVVTSITTHSIWVKTDLTSTISAIDALFNGTTKLQVATLGAITDLDTPADGTDDEIAANNFDATEGDLQG